MGEHVGVFMQMDLKRISVLLVLVITLSACVGVQSMLLPSNDVNRKEIKSCTVIDEPGRYELTADIRNGGGTGISQSCIEIRSGNVILDGNGHAIDGRGNSHTTAIQVKTTEDGNDILITNMTLTDWHKGVAFENGSQGKIQNVTAASNVYGIAVENSSQVITKDNKLRRNLVGMKISDDSIHIELWGNTFSDNQVKTM